MNVGQSPLSRHDSQAPQTTSAAPSIPEEGIAKTNMTAPSESPESQHENHPHASSLPECSAPRVARRSAEPRAPLREACRTQTAVRADSAAPGSQSKSSLRTSMPD